MVNRYYFTDCGNPNTGTISGNRMTITDDEGTPTI